VFLPARGDLILIGSDDPIRFDMDVVGRRMKEPRSAAILEEVSIYSPLDLMTMYLFTIDREEGNRAWEAVRGAPLNRDDNMLLEFSAPRHMDDPGVFENRDAMAELHDRSKLHEAAGYDHLALAESAVRLWDLPVAELEIAYEERKAEPDLLGIRCLKARILLARAGWENNPALAGEALDEARAAIEIDRESSEANLLLGTAHLRTGAWTEAEKYFREAIRLGADPAVANVYLGVALERAGKREEAIEAYREALALDPRNEPAIQGLGRLRARR
jgi:tetratricopeptide (TPR) repeat protein